MILDPCRPLMPNAAWRAFMRRVGPHWHAPLHHAALALVACAGVAGAPLPAGPVQRALPWIAAPGWVQHGAYEYPSGGLPGPLSASIAPGGPLGGGGAALFGTAQTVGRLEPAPLTAGGSPALASAPATPRQDVPEPASVALLAATTIAIIAVRKNGGRNRADTLADRATSTMETTHA